MQVQISIRDLPVSSALEEHIRLKAEKLEQYFNRITHCAVVIELVQKHKHQGKLFHARIDLSVPGNELVVSKKYDEDVYIAVRDAFNAMERQLEDYIRKLRGDTKTHSEIVHGIVARIFKEEGYGFIEGNDDTEYYFSLTNVSHPTFEQLSAGDFVQFVPQVSSEGVHAHHIKKEKYHEIL